MKLTYRHVPESCRPMAELLNRIGDKWSIAVILRLSDRTMRFSELRRTLAGISQKMLTTTLRILERDGFVTRTVIQSIPPRVEYELTDLGRDLSTPIAALKEWVKLNNARVEAARITFDKRDRYEAR